MPSSLRFVLLLCALATIAAAASIIVIFGQDAARARTTAEAITGGRVDAGKAAIGRYGCGACHRIPGIAGVQGSVGPPLDAIADRAEIAGALANTPPNLTRWLRDPQGVSPGNGMPDQGVTDAEARDMAAYLYTVRR